MNFLWNRVTLLPNYTAPHHKKGNLNEEFILIRSAKVPFVGRPFTGRPTGAISVDLPSEAVCQALRVIVPEASPDCSATTFLLRLTSPEEESATTHRNFEQYLTTVMTQFQVPEDCNLQQYRCENLNITSEISTRCEVPHFVLPFCAQIAVCFHIIWTNKMRHCF